MFKTRKTRQLASAMELLRLSSQELQAAIEQNRRALELAQNNAELRDRAIINAETWQCLYEEAVTKSKPLENDVVLALKAPHCRWVN
jgi:hypothetical protein